MKKLLCVFVMMMSLALTSCTEIELGSHIAKQVNPPSKSQGKFKVGNPYKIAGKYYTPKESYTLVETGIASWYGPNFHGKMTANGEIFDQNELTAAHRTLQMPSLVRVTNLDNGRSLIVRVNDRGPYKRGRVIDLSKRAAELLGFKNAGTAKVRIEVLKEESLAVAEAAKAGKSTRGYEVALNNGQQLPTGTRTASMDTTDTPRGTAYQQASMQASSYQSPSVGSVERETLVTQPSNTELQRAIPGHTKGGAFYPDPIVTEMPVTRTNIYVQAGSFSVEANANNLARKLSGYATTNVYAAQVNGQQFYRVRLGPVTNVEEADEILERLVNGGNQSAIIVVE
ncbi:MAG: septal ring lytic transglycosylase RlpA family protein [Pseudomonadota bacterium]|nr:septal ring lytic transglycosylase RlpA family protein [Pseudomonadota bacterium]